MNQGTIYDRIKRFTRRCLDAIKKALEPYLDPENYGYKPSSKDKKD